MKVLNLYAGIGGNRKLWPDTCQVTAVENNADIAVVYQKNFPNDEVLVGDAHQYLLEHYQEFDFIWSSPPCPTHSDIRRMGVHAGYLRPKYADMKLYEEIILLTHFSKCPWIVENVVSYYNPLIQPVLRGRHYFWSNYIIPDFKNPTSAVNIKDVHSGQDRYGFSLKGVQLEDKRAVLRNLVDPKLGLHVFNSAFKVRQEVLA